MASYQVKPKQSLFDIAIEVYGDVQGVVWLVQDNPHVPGLTGPIAPGEMLNIRQEMINARQAQALADFAPFQTIGEDDLPSGIGFWSLDDYQVQ